MKYFLHDTSAFDDEKITELFIKFGYEGIGLFYTALEKIARQEKPVKTEVLKTQLRVGKRLEKCWLFMEEIGILSSNNGETFNEQLLKFSGKYQINKEKTRKKVSEWRERKRVEENVTGYVPVSNPPKVKESKVNTINNNSVVTQKVTRVTEFTKKVEGYNAEIKLPDIEIEKFLNYWLQDGGQKLHFEKQKTFDIKRRMKTWQLNIKNDGKFQTDNRKVKSEVPRKRTYDEDPLEALKRLRIERGYNQ